MHFIWVLKSLQRKFITTAVNDVDYRLQGYTAFWAIQQIQVRLGYNIQTCQRMDNSRLPAETLATLVSVTRSRRMRKKMDNVQ